MDNLGSWYVSIWPLFLVLFLLGIVWCVICLKSDQSILIHCLHYVVASKSSWVSIYSPVGSGRNWVSSFCVLSLGFHLYLELVCSPVLICVKISCLFGSPLYGWIMHMHWILCWDGVISQKEEPWCSMWRDWFIYEILMNPLILIIQVTMTLHYLLLEQEALSLRLGLILLVCNHAIGFPFQLESCKSFRR